MCEAAEKLLYNTAQQFGGVMWCAFLLYRVTVVKEPPVHEQGKE